MPLLLGRVSRYERIQCRVYILISRRRRDGREEVAAAVSVTDPSCTFPQIIPVFPQTLARIIRIPKGRTVFICLNLLPFLSVSHNLWTPSRLITGYYWRINELCAHSVRLAWCALCFRPGSDSRVSVR